MSLSSELQTGDPRNLASGLLSSHIKIQAASKWYGFHLSIGDKPHCGLRWQVRSKAPVQVFTIMANVLVQRMIDLIDHEYTAPITLRTISARIGRQPAYLGQLFRQEVGTTVREYVARVRLTHAAELVLDGVKIEAISLCVGYRSKKNFYKQFKRCFGTTPVPYRRGFDVRLGFGGQAQFDVLGKPDSDSESILARVVSMVRASNRAWRLAVRAQRAMLKHFTRSRVAMLLTDHAGRYIGANQAATSLIGYSLYELRTLSPADLFVSAPSVDTRSAWQLMLSQSHDSNRPPNAQVRQRNGGVANVHLMTLRNELPLPFPIRLRGSCDREKP